MTTDTAGHQLALAHEAHALSGDELTISEEQALMQVDAWLKAALDEPAVDSSAEEHILGRRSGRVLFIGGGRGSGKTSLLLTILKGWKLKQSAAGFMKVPPATSLAVQVLLPILDFDPLPVDMPIQAWLLEPWRPLAKDLDARASRNYDRDLTELFANLFDRVIVGWTTTLAEGKDFLDQSLAFSEKTSGWLETQREWRAFIDALTCRCCSCTAESPKACKGHKKIFVIAVDDVDLQVEQIPSLLHALRLFHHPRVAYLLTGDFDHLRDVVELDFLHRHAGVAGRPDTYNSRHLGLIHEHSRRLADALMEKVLPRQVRLELPLLTLRDVVATIGKSRAFLATAFSEQTPKAQWGDLRFATARRAQQAVDLLPEAEPEAHRDGWLRPFIANLCQTTLHRGALTSSGTLRTVLGPILRSWEGDVLEIRVYQNVIFEFDPDFNPDRRRRGVDASPAVAARLFHEEKLAGAPALSWEFDAGVVATLVYWERETVLFHWPILTPPTVAEALTLTELATRLLDVAHSAQNAKELPVDMLKHYIAENIKWWLRAQPPAAPGQAPPPEPLTFERWTSGDQMQFLDEMIKIDSDVDRWLLELRVMALPFFGLPPSSATHIQTITNRNGAGQDEEKLETSCIDLVSTAILAQTSEKPGSDVLARKANEFIDYWRKRDRDASRWGSLLEKSSSPASPQANGPTGTPDP